MMNDDELVHLEKLVETAPDGWFFVSSTGYWNLKYERWDKKSQKYTNRLKPTTPLRARRDIERQIELINALNVSRVNAAVELIEELFENAHSACANGYPLLLNSLVDLAELTDIFSQYDADFTAKPTPH
jgi:hypothetical protein